MESLNYALSNKQQQSNLNTNIDEIIKNQMDKHEQELMKQIEQEIQNFTKLTTTSLTQSIIQSSQMGIQPQNNKETQHIHPNSKCHSCNCEPIKGIRYLCVKCNYELCSQCEEIVGASHDHPFYKLIYPI